MQHFVARASTSVTRGFRCASVRRKAWALRGAVALIALLGTILLPPTAARGQASPPSILKSFGASSVPLGGSTTLGFALTNPNPMTFLTGVAFTDTLPAGLVVATPNGLTGSCVSNGIGGTITATAGSGSISLTGGGLPPAFACSIVVNVTGTTAGDYTNTTGPVTSTNGGAGNTASANLAVVAPPTIAKTFGAASVSVGGTTSLTFDVFNPNRGLALNGVAFTDTLPAGLVVATPNGLNFATCFEGTITATAGSGSISFTGGDFPDRSGCLIRLNVTATSRGVQTNRVQVTSISGGTGNTATATLTVPSPPSITKVFGATSVPVGGTTSLTFTITNPNPSVALTGVAFTDTLPTGLVVATPNGLTGSCGSTPTATAGSGSVSLSGGTIPAGGSCLFAVNVTATTAVCCSTRPAPSLRPKVGTATPRSPV